MKSLITWLRLWLTDERRQAIHGALAALAVLAVAAGGVNANQSDALLSLAAAVLALLQGLLALSMLRKADASTWFATVGRGLVYGLATASGAVGVVFHWWTNAEVTHALELVTSGLVVVSAVLAVVFAKTATPVPPGLTRREYRAHLVDDSTAD